MMMDRLGKKSPPISGAFYHAFAFFNLVLIASTITGAKKVTSTVPCLSPSFCAALHRRPCNPLRFTDPCGPCLYGVYITKQGQELCFPGETRMKKYSRQAQLRRQDEDDEDEQKFAESYLESLLSRLDEKQQKKMIEAAQSMEKMTTTTTTTAANILRTKSPSVAAFQQHQRQGQLIKATSGNVDFTTIALITCVAIAAAFGVVISVFCFVRIHRRSRALQRFDYTGPGKSSGSAPTNATGTGLQEPSAASVAASKLSSIFGGGHGADKATVDRKLANNAALYHFEHHKKEMMAIESVDAPEFGDSDGESGDENDVNDYTVYECPGLAPTGEMQVDNPLFRFRQQTSQPPGSQPSVVVRGIEDSPK